MNYEYELEGLRRELPGLVCILLESKWWQEDSENRGRKYK
jgi:hypothetical protein